MDKAVLGTVGKELPEGLAKVAPERVFERLQPAVVAIASKCVSVCDKYMENDTGKLAAQMRVFDPRQRPAYASKNVDQFPLAIASRFWPLLTAAAEGVASEWDKYTKMAIPDAGVRLLSWWEDCSGVLPQLSVIARRMLKLPMTTIGVESSFSMYSTTRSDQQFHMHDDTHIARLSCVFNGMVPRLAR